MKYLLLVVAFMATGIAQAQEPTYRIGQYYEGYIVEKDGEKVRGYIQYLSESQRYEKVLFKKEKNGKKSKYKPKDIYGYKVADTEYRACQFKSVLFKDTKFLQVAQDGCMEQLEWRKYDSDDQSWSSEIVLRVNGEAESTQRFVMSFAKHMSKMVKDNKELYNKVKNKEKGYRLLSLEAIVREYNEQCED
ncbi:MAG: hypothetical protein ACSHWW_05605 [Nonlabens sp.]|uniref:hypothetical protein n=1 Tax=Nonlabens sp. TaxID=1888209 RepID=UPI003EF3E62A